MKIMGIGVPELYFLRFVLALALVAAVIVIVVLQSRDARASMQCKSKKEKEATSGYRDQADVMEELKELAELHVQGALTDREYSLKKKQILNL